MKITYPRNKRKISKLGGGVLYVLLGRSRNEQTFWLMDFWSKPYTFKSYKDAVKGAEVLSKKMKLYSWEDTKPLIMKLEFKGGE